MINAQNLIAGAWVGDPDFERRNPANPDEVVAVAPSAGVADVHDAVAAASDAQPGWAALSPMQRGAILMDAADLLRRRHEDIATDLTREEGKTRAEAMGEVRRAIDVLRFFGSAGWRTGGETLPSTMPNTSVHTRQEPLGVVGLITPWNFPIAIPAWKMAPALVSGNAVVIKPAELTPLSINHLATALVDAGLPAGVLNVVHGSGSVAGDTLIRHQGIAAVSFTGSTGVGMAIRDVLNARNARVQLEMGGKNAYLVLDDADVEAAAATVAAGAFSLTGQACTATSRVYVTPGVREVFVKALREKARAVKPGNGLDPGTTMGPVVSEAQLAKDVAAIGAAVEAGFDVGEVRDHEAQFLAPVVVSGVLHDHPLATDEVFGPVVGVIDVADYEQGLDLVNDSSYGLTAGVCTRDLGKAYHFAARAQVGVVKINRPTTGLDLNVPFGGVRDSSTNTFREQGERAVDFYTWTKSVYIGHDL
ncbi:aldehyde dehydrogenase family protein [Mycolicibacterium smegmatis]|uniref:aldehyde dehydrogenase family protein n=1 Tax=Mycolicibacterium smegmatis TaxID=1772 RepID=UPI001E4FD2E4|nr:aldehyde dehydrogenase family protein [Mycolicibacterium smegmatis]UGU30506.1 aldehyde dehydrogenase family protein [Mycolicibacterium smegmatis]ULN71430.1 aldehyde dehydrogenase family protein [Mycolicibacterium smegmatis]